MTQDKRIGIIDLGSNSVRLVIFEIGASGSFRLIDDISDTVRLSEGMLDGKYLNDFAMRRAIKAVKLFRKLCSAYGILPKDIIAVATAAVRKADNRDHFLNLMYSSTGLAFRLLSGEEEALYVYRAVIQTIDVNDGIIVDIGGGSTEIVKFKNKTVVNYVSVPLGAVVATEEYLDKNIINAQKLAALESEIRRILLGFEWLVKEQIPILIGLGGTVRNFAKIHRRLSDYPLDISHNYSIDIQYLHNIYEKLSSMDLDARKKVEGMSAKRADIIVGGLAILKTISSIADSKQLVVSGSGLREGILFEYVFEELAEDKGRNLNFPGILDFSLSNIMSLYTIRQEHSDHVCQLALSMFDQLRDVHNLGDHERRLLRVAALLHDIGTSVSYYDHHRHSFYIIINSRLNGLSHREIVLAAAIAASHRRDKFKEDWEKFYKQILQPGDAKMSRKLSMFLKIAECLDRSETGVIKSVECHVDNKSVKIRTVRDDDAELELIQANENNENFKKIFGKNLLIN